MPAPTASDIERAVLALLAERASGATICPSEIARRLTAGADGWRALMPNVRAVADRLARQGVVRVTRNGVEVDAKSPGGPIRLGLRR